MPNKTLKRRMRYFGLDPRSKWDRDIYKTEIKGGKGSSPTGLANGNRFVHMPKSANEIQLASTIEGQLSDGKWENSPSMEKYWKRMRTTNNGVIINRGWGGSRWNREKQTYESPGSSNASVKTKIANFASQLLKDDTSEETRKYFNQDININNNTETNFFDYADPKTDKYKSPTVGQVKKTIKDLKK